VYLSAEMTARIVHGAPAAPETGPHTGLSRLTDRELEVFDSIGRGLSTRHIAEALSLSVKTVEAHRENIKRKLAIKDSSGLARRADGCVPTRSGASGPRGRRGAPHGRPARSCRPGAAARC